MSLTHSVTYLQRFLLVVIGVLAFSGLNAQTVSGTVTSSTDGSPLIGATVLVKGTTTGAFTDDDGKFSVTAGSDATLIISYVGYSRVEIPVGGRSTVNVELAASESTLDEVVVTGYSTQKAKEVTSSITSVKAEDFNQGNVSDPTQLIQGKVPGLQISRPGGDPNGGFTIRLRGVSSLGANQAPLIIIDGVIGAELQTVDPNDIQSVDVLKDGSAAAIYGARASAGVIIITTKKGLPGRATVDYNGFVSSETVAGRVSVATPEEFVQYGGPDLGGSTNWIDEMTRNAISQAHNLSLSGGNAQTTYRASLNFRDQQGVAIGTGFQQLNARLNLTQKAINDKLTLTMNFSSTNRDSDFGWLEAFRYGSTYNPTAPIRFGDETDPNFDAQLNDRYGGYFQQVNFDYFNPVAMLEQNINEGTFSRVLMSGRANYELIDGLSADIFYSQQRTNGNQGQYRSRSSYWIGADRGGLANTFNNESFNQLLETTLRYNKAFGNTTLDAVGGYSYQQRVFQGFGAEGGRFLTDAFSYNSIGAGQDFDLGNGNVYSYKNSDLLISFFGNVGLNIDDTYFVRAALRRDGSSTFGDNNKWGLFGAASAGVTLSNLFDIANVDILKLRAGYGITGALPPSSYLSLLRFSPVSNFFYNGEFVPAFGPSLNANPDLRWERKTEINVGLDFELFDYKVFGSLDYYNRVTEDLLFFIPVPVPPNQAGFTWGNIGDAVLRNSGIEFLLGYRMEKGNFSWEPTLNFATYNIILDTTGVTDAPFTFFRDETGLFFDPNTSPGAPGLNNDPSVVAIAGGPLGNFWGLTYTGVDDNGNFTFEDIDGDGIAGVDAAGNVDPDDEGIIGNGVPEFSIGFQNQFKIGKLDIGFFFRGDFGHEMVNHYRVFYESLGARSVDNLVITEYFNPELTGNPLFSSHYVEKADFIALDNATIGYTFDMGNTALRNLRFYVTGQNLFYITNYSGFDPNVRWTDSNTGSPLAPGLDRRNLYSRTRTITVGVNVGL